MFKARIWAYGTSELGAPLIDRSGRTARLTTTGAAVIEQARAVLESVHAVRRAADEVTGLIRGRLVVGMVNGCTNSGLFDALAAFHLAHPGIEISLIEDNSARLTERVRKSDADLALIGTAGPPPPGLDALPITSERLVVAVPLGHALARRQRATLADIAGRPVVCMPEGTAPRTMFDQACAAKGMQPDIVLQASAPDAVADLAIRGLGVAILTESMAANHRRRLKALVLDDIPTPAGLALIWTTTRSPALQEFLLHAHRAFPGDPATVGPVETFP